MAGDLDARFDDCFRRDYAPVCRVVVLIVRDAAVAEEITQEAFTQAFVRWRRVSTYDRPGAWVRLVAVRLAVKSARRAERGTVASVAVAGDRAGGWGSAGSHHDDHVTGPLDGRVAAALAVLSPQQRAAVVLHHLEDQPVAEVARLLGCTEATAKVHLHRGRRRLAALLAAPPGSIAGSGSPNDPEVTPA